MPHRLLALLVLLSGCGARSTLSIEGEPAADPDAAVEPAPPDEEDPPELPELPELPPVEPIGECEATGVRGLSVSDPVSLEVADRSVFLASVAGDTGGFLAVVEDRWDFTRKIVRLSGDGGQVEWSTEWAPGNGAKIASSAETGTYALTTLNRSLDRVTVEVGTPAIDTMVLAAAVELGPTSEGILYAVDPVFAAGEWVVGYRTEEAAVVRTLPTPADGGWAFEHRYGADVALAADSTTGITYVAIYRPGQDFQITKMGPDGDPLPADGPVAFDPPLEDVLGLSASGWNDRVFVLGLRGRRVDDTLEACLLRPADLDFASCIALSSGLVPGSAALSSQVLDVRVREMALAAVVHRTPDEGFVLDLAWTVDWHDGSSLSSGARVDVADDDTGINTPDSNELFGPMWGGVDVVPIRCGVLVAWGQMNGSGRIGTAVVRFSP